MVTGCKKCGICLEFPNPQFECRSRRDRNAEYRDRNRLLLPSPGRDVSSFFRHTERRLRCFTVFNRVVDEYRHPNDAALNSVNSRDEFGASEALLSPLSR